MHTLRHLAHIEISAVPPREFRIFRAGENPTSQGPVLFDTVAAESVLAKHAQRGVDVMIDLEHDALDSRARAARSDAGDARGWCKLAVRGGELWAICVSWTLDGARRLAERTQRYVSPAIRVDDDGRVIELVNIALCAMPATEHAQPLVLAMPRRLSMSPEIVKKITDAIAAPPGGDELVALLTEILTSLVPTEEPAPEPLAEEPEVAPADPEKPKEEPELARTLSSLRLSVVEAVAEIGRMRAELDARACADRGALVAELVRLGAETPATAYHDGKLVGRLAGEPVSSMRLRVAALGKAAPRSPEPPVSALVELTAPELARAARMTPAERDRYTQVIAAVRGTKGAV